MQPNGLPHQCRLHLKRDFERVILGGTKLKYNAVVCWYGKTDSRLPARFAVVVSKKLGPAVLRNRTKRLLREAFRQIRKNLVLLHAESTVSVCRWLFSAIILAGESGRKVRAAQGIPLLKVEAIGDSRIRKKKTTASCKRGKGEKVV